LINHSPTIGSLFDVVVRYQPIFMRGMGYTLLTSDQQVELRWDVYRPDCEGVRLDVEFTLGALLRLLQLKVGRSVAPLDVSFRHQPVPPMATYQQVFGCKCRFGQAQNCIVFAQNLMQIPLSGGDPKLLDILKTQADTMLQQWHDHHSFLGQVKFLITTSLEHPEGGMEALAKKLNMTSRTLNRRLAREGTSYQKLRDDIRMHAAKRALAESDASVTAIAGKLGFSESSAFVRAFRRVAGVTPVAYRSTFREQ
jgi:AraC-like DNA-binding protein